MKVKINYGMEGAFKFDLYSGGKLVESSDWFSNFITQTGLLYPLSYPFVNCFRFLSLGNNGNVNSGIKIGSSPTTGLLSPLTGINTSAGVQSGTYIGWQGYETGTAGQESACGTVLTESGPRFFRAWTIPTGGLGTTVNEPAGFLNIQEFMVSPSSGNDPNGGQYAFSRIVRNLSIPNGFSAIVSYQLRINIQNTGITYFPSGSFATGNADVSNDPDLVASWGNLSGYFRQVCYGLESVDSAGASYIPVWGAPMEPYQSDLSTTSFYLSPDNSDFEVNGSGGAQSDPVQAYKADGLMKQLGLWGLDMTYPNTTIVNLDPNGLNNLYNRPAPDGVPLNWPTVNTPINIRLGGGGVSLDSPSVADYAVVNNLPSTFNYQTFQQSAGQSISYATPGINGFDPSRTNFGQKAVFSTAITKLPFAQTGQNLPTGRKKTITRRTTFSPKSSLGYNTRFGSLVYAFNQDNTQSQGNRVYYPMIDCLFFDSSGRSLMPHYRYINVFLTNRGTGIANATISIIPSGTNVSIFNNLQTFQGNYNGGFVSGFDTTHPCFTDYLNGNLLTPIGVLLPGNVDPNNTDGSTVTGTYNSLPYTGFGYGEVYGIVVGNNYYQNPPDVGLTDHSLTVNTAPNPSGTLFWPSVVNGAPLKLSINNIQYFSANGCFGGIQTPLTSGQGAYNWSTNPCKFCPPTGYIVHSESYTGALLTNALGYRLLPNYGIPNNVPTDTYNASTGGAYPGLSFDNGLELGFDISWSSPCGGASDCNEPI